MLLNLRLQQNLGPYPELGEPIELSENGPLGALWPEGEPNWYREAFPIFKKLLAKTDL